jgi:GDSL-like lipase/acylhydrolase family protein
MRTWTAIASAVAASAAVWCGALAQAQAAETCAVPGYLLFGDSLLQRVTAVVAKEKTLRIVVLGGASSTLPGPDGTQSAYPARLDVALKQLLPSVAVTVTADIKTRQSAEEAADHMDKLMLDQKPNLVVWQAGTYDAVRGTDLEDFRSSIADGVEKIQASGADVVLLNMQYSPRTESMVAVGAYADSMRWVAREREVPVFDRLAIMRHWYESGQFNLYATTKDLSTAKQVHDCIGRALASLIIDAARLPAREGTTAQ